MSCCHLNDSGLRKPEPNQAVYREDCTQCFDSIDDQSGLDVCLHCFNGGCTNDRFHSLLHSQNYNHPLVLNIRRIRKPVQRDEPPKKISKLSIAAETEADRYFTITKVKCFNCGVDDIDATAGRLPSVIDGIMTAMTFSRHEEVKAWEQEITACEHTLCLKQEPKRNIESQDLGHCYMCDLKENLWLCLQCGNLGCGREQFRGVRGNSHALAHRDATDHPVAVKLGSITPEGTADVYCYSCNDDMKDPELGPHLANWGLILAEREKTEKSLTEMQIEQNHSWEFSMTTEDGKELTPLFGKGFTGLKNIGNSCYLASVLQCLFSLENFGSRYNLPDHSPPVTSSPAEDLETQLRKIADGLLSGRYSFAGEGYLASEYPQETYQKGLAPSMFKHLIGRGHPEFSTMRQQDAFELLLHLLKLITRSNHPGPLTDPVKDFRFLMEQRLQCLSCKKVRYKHDEQDNLSVAVPVRRINIVQPENTEAKDANKPLFEAVTFKKCLDNFTAIERVELTCPSCGSKDGFTKRSLFKTFPKVLVVNARRFELVNWVPTKLDIPVTVGDEPFTLDVYKSLGLQPNEEALPEEEIAKNPSFAPNPETLAQLEGMGFPRLRCEKALHATGNGSSETAMTWLFAHMEDPDIDTPLDLGAPKELEEDPEKIANLESMGFQPNEVRRALKETGSDLNRAIEWLFSHAGEVDNSNDTEPSNDETESPKEISGSDELPANFVLHSIVCHKGASIHAGHYVSFIRKLLPFDTEDSWVLFNDEKVVKAVDVDEMKKFAYIYFFKRV
ncbi:MAG: hypothetical protein M1829_004984 [Trizodia sp. TS-e1964]|nr:MAG: hypothetical protein M1829_004984 [Trizodia sp. TS-e1964]